MNEVRQEGPATRAVITGIGMVCPLGRHLPSVFAAACRAESGLVRPPDGHPGAGTAEALGIAPPIGEVDGLSRAEARLADRFVLLALAAAHDAIRDSRLRIGIDVDPYRTAVVIATGAGGTSTYEAQAIAHADRGRRGVSAYMQSSFLPNMAAARISIALGTRGYSTAVAAACASGTLAVAEAQRLIRSGDADVVICGGTEAPISPTGIASFANARVLARGWTDPAQASRPFDRLRNGFVLGEGAAVLVVERTVDADARGVAGYADLVGWGATSDAYHSTSPRPTGDAAAESMRLALRRAGLTAGDVGYLNAHGPSTRAGDIAEARAIRTVFGTESPPVSSTKGVTGHLLGASGAVEAAICALSISSGLLPPTKNLEDPDPECELNHVRGEPTRSHVGAALSNSFGFGGHNASLLLARPSTRQVRSVAATSVSKGDPLRRSRTISR